MTATKSVIATNTTTGLVVAFDSIGHATRLTGADRPSITRCCNGEYNRKTAKGFTWTWNNSTNEST